MRLTASSLRSRFARRIFLQFIVCAIVPVAALAVLSFDEISSQMRDVGHKQLVWQSKAVGMQTLSQLNLCASRLEELAQRLGAKGRGQAAVGPPGCLQSFLILPREAAAQGAAAGFRVRQFSSAQLAGMEKGRTILSTVNEESGANIWMSRQLRAGEILAARVDPGFLWQADALPESLDLCVLNEDGAALHCPGPNAARVRENLLLQKAGAIRGEFEWQAGRESFLAGYWAVFLQAQFHSPAWKVVISEPVNDVFDPVSHFRKTFPLTMLLAVSVVFLFSLIQIRRSLAPLERLREGTRRIAHRDFATQVNVRSGDEFEELASSFNSMSSELAQQFLKLDRLNLGTLTALARAIDAKSRWTSGHSERVTGMAVRLGRALGLPQNEIDTLHRGGLLHDIGKIGTPAEILDKPGKLTDEEMRIMRDHVRQGARILEPLPGFEDVMPIVLEHHEWFNGKGYPAGLKGREITLHGRIFGVADVFDALISERPYRPGWELPRVIDYIRSGAGAQFDPEVVRVFLELMAQDEAEGRGSRESSLEPVNDLVSA